MSTPRYYLRQIIAERYGAFVNRELGTFKPGLNVVFGPNEAGKSTFSSLMNGILFGWEESHGVQNTYMSADGTRSGMLVFAPEDDAQGEDDADPHAQQQDLSLVRIMRIGDQPLEGKQKKLILSDIDRATYRTMFSFSSDELRSLDNSNDVTARLLSAGSGTAASPSSVYLELEQRIAALTSLSPDATDSVIVLAQQLEDKRSQVQEMARHVEQLKQNDRELRELLSNRDDANVRLNELDRAIDQFTKAVAEIQDMEGRVAQLKTDLAETQRELEELKKQQVNYPKMDKRLMELDANDVRRLRDKLDEFELQREKLTRVEDAAKENSTKSKAGYEAIVELDRQSHAEDAPASASRRKAGRAAATIVPSIVFFVAGIALFFYGRRINSLSFTVLSIGLIALAFVLGLAAAAGVRRMTRDSDNLESRIKDAQWIMLQDQKRLDSSQSDVEALAARINDFLEGAGLGEAQGSLRHAWALLNDAQEARTQKMQDNQREAALQLRVETVKDEMAQLTARRAQLEETLQVQPGTSVGEIDDLLQAKIAQRAALRTIADETSHRIGQLTQELKTARDNNEFDELKLEAELIRTRLREAKEQLAELLLARRMLERAMVSWEGDNQPRVYEEAGRLLALITDGRWVGVSTSTTGSIVAINSDGSEVKPRHLSLGTCQQLYLALRVALLITAQDVGQSVPVMADDILVHFDEERRAGAARVLAELARLRQIIVFTCHQETVTALREASSEFDVDMNYITLERL